MIISLIKTLRDSELTVRPLDRVVDSVVAPWLTGVAKFRRNFKRLGIALRLRKACATPVASLREVIGAS